jgi:putative ABC transport system permease protein
MTRAGAGSRRPPRRQRLATSFGVAAQLVAAGLVAAPSRVVAALAGHTAALAMVAASPVAGRLDEAYLQGGALLVATVAAGVASAVDRRELRSMAAADACGASGLQRRLVVLVEGVALGLVALPLGLAAGAAVCAVAGSDGPRVLPTVATALVVPGLVTLFAGRIRTRVTAVDATADREVPAGAGRRVDVLRLVVGVGCVVTAALLSRRLRAFWELDLAVGPLVVLAAVGLLLALSPVVGWIGGGLARARSVPVALAGTALRDRRRLLAPAAALGAVAALVVAVQAVVGLGLAEREQARREHVGATSRLTAGLSDRDVFVGRLSPILPFGWLAGVPAPGYLQVDPAVPGSVADAVRAAVPSARVAPVDVLPVSVHGDPVVPSVLSRRAVVGTPELVAALGLEQFAGDLAAGRAVALDPSAVVADQVTLTSYAAVLPGWRQVLPARVVQREVVPQYQPAVLVPPALGLSVLADVPPDSTWHEANPAALVVGRARGFSAAEVADIRRAVAGAPDTAGGSLSSLSVVAGGTRVTGAFEQDRLDESYAIVLDSPADVRLAVGVAVAVTLVALAVALRLAALTGRPDDELLDMLGARPATLRQAAVGQALVLGLLAVPLGTTVGVLAARVGLSAYNGSGRFADGVELPPIPVTVPASLVVGALVVPLVAALVAGLLAGRRRPADLQSVADRLAW